MKENLMNRTSPFLLHVLCGFLGLALLPALIPVDAVAADHQVSELKALHHAGQTRLTWKEVDPIVTQDTILVKELRKIRQELDAGKKVRYRIYRSERPVRSVDDLEPICEVPPLTCWNADFYGVSPKPEHQATRYIVQEGGKPVPPGTGIAAHNPTRTGNAYYAVTVVIDGEENRSLDDSNSLVSPVEEKVGQGEPVLQRIEKPERFNYVDSPTLHYYVRWESPPNCALAGKPYDYLVAIPPNLKKPAPVGIHLHCWGANLNGGYGWWYRAEKGHLLIASNQIPYDWWTGYHERYFEGSADEETWKNGVVRPYSQIRMLSFLDWVATHWEIDRSRTHVAGSSMGGSGSPMLAIRYSEKIAWATSWVGVHNPGDTPGFIGSYERVYGERDWDIRFENGESVWNHFNDSWYLRKYPEKEIGLICFANGKNDGGIGWPQAVEFYRALAETRRPHIFVWGQDGHRQRARLPVTLSDRYMTMDLRTDQCQPAFTDCSLDDNPGNGEPSSGDTKGQVNLYLYWQTDDIVDRPDRLEMTVGLVDQSPADACTVNITPRRLQNFKLKPGSTVRWTNTAIADGKVLQQGNAIVDKLGLITLVDFKVSKEINRLTVMKR